MTKKHGKNRARDELETKVLTQLSRIRLLLLKVSRGQRVTAREGRAALKDLVDVENLRNTPPDPRTVGTLRAFVEAEASVLDKLRRGATLTELQEITGRARSTLLRHRDSLAAHGCLTRLYPGLDRWGSWVTTKYARENLADWEQIYSRREKAGEA